MGVATFRLARARAAAAAALAEVSTQQDVASSSPAESTRVAAAQPAVVADQRAQQNQHGNRHQQRR